MTPIEQEIARIELENAKLCATKRPPKQEVSDDMGALYRMTAKHPGFAAFCRPRLGGPIPTMAEIIAKARKTRAAELRNFMKPKGIYSILKGGAYTTGRLLSWEGEPTEEKLKLIRVSRDEWTSEEPWKGESIPQNIPDFGKDPVKPPEIDEEDGEDSQEQGYDWPNQAQAEGSAQTDVRALIEAIEAQNALLRDLGSQKAA